MYQEISESSFDKLVMQMEYEIDIISLSADRSTYLENSAIFYFYMLPPLDKQQTRTAIYTEKYLFSFRIVKKMVDEGADRRNGARQTQQLCPQFKLQDPKVRHPLIDQLTGKLIVKSMLSVFLKRQSLALIAMFSEARKAFFMRFWEKQFDKLLEEGYWIVNLQIYSAIRQLCRSKQPIYKIRQAITDNTL